MRVKLKAANLANKKEEQRDEAAGRRLGIRGKRRIKAEWTEETVQDDKEDG